MQTIGSFFLENDGGFVCQTGCMYINGDGGTGTDTNGGRISVGTSEYYSPGDHGVQPNSPVQLYISIEAGSDRTGGSYFMWDPTATVSARYSISGTTLDSDVHFHGVS